MDKSTRDKAGEGAPSSGKKPYTAPTFRSESVFVISALACGRSANDAEWLLGQQEGVLGRRFEERERREDAAARLVRVWPKKLSADCGSLSCSFPRPRRAFHSSRRSDFHPTGSRPLNFKRPLHAIVLSFWRVLRPPNSRSGYCCGDLSRIRALHSGSSDGCDYKIIVCPPGRWNRYKNPPPRRKSPISSTVRRKLRSGTRCNPPRSTCSDSKPAPRNGKPSGNRPRRERLSPANLWRCSPLSHCRANCRRPGARMSRPMLRIVPAPELSQQKRRSRNSARPKQLTFDTVTLEFPAFVRVRLRALLFPTVTFPKFKLEALVVRSAVAAIPSSAQGNRARRTGDVAHDGNIARQRPGGFRRKNDIKCGLFSRFNRQRKRNSRDRDSSRRGARLRNRKIRSAAIRYRDRLRSRATNGYGTKT